MLAPWSAMRPATAAMAAGRSGLARTVTWLRASGSAARQLPPGSGTLTVRPSGTQTAPTAARIVLWSTAAGWAMSTAIIT